MSDLHEAARHYAMQNIPIFPVHTPDPSGRCSCRDAACANVGKHPRTRNGLNDATTDIARINAYWSRRPDANIGIRTGYASRRFVVDIDPNAGGYDSTDTLQARYGPFPASLAVHTGGGGLHLHLAWPPQGMIRNSAGKLGPGVDVRGQGGYVLGPPSLHRSGTRYAWTGLDDATEMAAAPPWLLALIVERPLAPQPVSDVPAETGPIPEGQRNSALARAAGAMRRHGLSEAEILAALERVNIDRCRPPLTDAEVERIAGSIARYPPSAPPASVPSELRLASGAVLRPIARGGRYGR